MTNTIKRILSCLAVILLLAFVLNGLTGTMGRKDDNTKYHDFFEEKNDIDVLFMGTSHVLNAVFPMELWNDYGIVSYNFGGHSNQMATSYWVMKNAVEHKKPKLAVIDCYTVGTNRKTSGNFSYVHLSMDSFPLSLTKIRAVNDLLNDPGGKKYVKKNGIKETEKRTKIGLLWDYSTYHTRWKELSKSDFVLEEKPEKGAETRIKITPPKSFDKISPDEKTEKEFVGIDYLEKAIQDCQNAGIDVLLTFVPFPAREQHQRDANRVKDIAEKYGVGYINFLDMDIVDLQTDCYDEASHLNASGARKITDYLGEYITDHYDLPDRREDPAYHGWFDDYREYEEFKLGNLQDCSKLSLYLMLLYDHNFDVMIQVKDPSIWESQSARNLLGNIGVSEDMMTEKTHLLAIKEGGKEVSAVVRPSRGRNTVLGTVSYQWAEDDRSKYSILLNGKKLCDVDTEKNPNDDVRIIVMRKGTEEVVDAAAFDLTFTSDAGETNFHTNDIVR